MIITSFLIIALWFFHMHPVCNIFFRMSISCFYFYGRNLNLTFFIKERIAHVHMIQDLHWLCLASCIFNMIINRKCIFFFGNRYCSFENKLSAKDHFIFCYRMNTDFFVILFPVTLCTWLVCDRTMKWKFFSIIYTRCANSLQTTGCQKSCCK